MNHVSNARQRINSLLERHGHPCGPWGQHTSLGAAGAKKSQASRDFEVMDECLHLMQLVSVDPR